MSDAEGAAGGAVTATQGQVIGVEESHLKSYNLTMKPQNTY